MNPVSQHLPASICRYLRKRAFQGPWNLEGCKRQDFDGAVIIPALAENDHLPATLDCLAGNPEDMLRRFLILIVINHSPDARKQVKEENAHTLRLLRNDNVHKHFLELAWVDAASPGRELPGKGGVGPARKIGFDLALQRCRHDKPDPPLLVSLDADTLVEKNYLAAIESHFTDHNEGCAVLPYRHRRGERPEIDAAIQHYELFLRASVLGLQRAGSPYAFHTIGSAIACRADAYVRAGGMNRRTSGEDFYFLQQMQKTTGVTLLHGTTVHPSPRPSLRVSFGTGPAVARYLEHPGDRVRFYHPSCFGILSDWLSCAEANWQEPETVLYRQACDISPHLGTFLRRLEFSANWKKLQANYRHKNRFLAAFHGWFDGLRTRQLLHYLSSGPLPYCDHIEALQPLFRHIGLPFDILPEEQLRTLRSFQSGEKVSS